MVSRVLHKKGLWSIVGLTAVASLLATGAFASSGGTSARTPSLEIAATAGRCSKATALRLVNQHRLDVFLSPNPVRQLLCGSFTGPGSDAMAVTIGAPTCWGTQRWAVFRFTEGDWQLVFDRIAFIFPLVAVGADIRETTPVFRPGDPRCIPSGGSHARIWHWNGKRLVAGPWKQVTKGEPERRGFYSPSHNIACGMYDDSSVRSVDCESYVPQQKVTMDVAGRLTICRDRTPSGNDCNVGNPGEGTPTLAYGKQITVGRFRCQSLQIGVRCVVIRSGKGFLINRDGVSRVGH